MVDFMWKCIVMEKKRNFGCAPLIFNIPRNYTKCTAFLLLLHKRQAVWINANDRGTSQKQDKMLNFASRVSFGVILCGNKAIIVTLSVLHWCCTGILLYVLNTTNQHTVFLQLFSWATQIATRVARKNNTWSHIVIIWTNILSQLSAYCNVSFQHFLFFVKTCCLRIVLKPGWGFPSNTQKQTD